MSDSNSNTEGSVAAKAWDGFMSAETFQNVPSVLLKDLSRRNAQNKSVLEHLDIAVYALLKAHARFKGECHPSLVRMASLAASSVSTIQRSFKRLEDAGHIQRKSHIKGKIIMLTDVTAKGQISRRAKISFPAAPRNSRNQTPPKIQDMTRVTSWQGEQIKMPPEEEAVKWESEDDPPF